MTPPPRMLSPVGSFTHAQQIELSTLVRDIRDLEQLNNILYNSLTRTHLPAIRALLSQIEQWRLLNLQLVG